MSFAFQHFCCSYLIETFALKAAQGSFQQFENFVRKCFAIERLELFSARRIEIIVRDRYRDRDCNLSSGNFEEVRVNRLSWLLRSNNILLQKQITT